MPPFSLPKSTKIASKIDPKMHQIFDRFLHRFFLHFGSILGPKLGPCWPHFPPKWGGAVNSRPPFCWVYVIFRFFGRPGPLLAQFGLDFGRFGPPFWRFLGSILEVVGFPLASIGTSRADLGSGGLGFVRPGGGHGAPAFLGFLLAPYLFLRIFLLSFFFLPFREEHSSGVNQA